jgi:hypothetical protein
MNWLDRLTPLNLLDEKAKFFADNSYNPQFIYEEETEEKDLIRLGVPKKEYVALAQEILDKTFFGRNEQDLLMMEGKKVSQEEVTEKFKKFLAMHDLEKRFEIIWSSSFIARATMTNDAVKLRSTSTFHREGLIGLIYHEIGTHALRRVNYEKQPWFRKKKKFGMLPDYLKTEEGLAALHALIPHTFKSVYTSAIRYLAVDYGHTHSFAELWKFLGKYVQDPETRWMITLRQKRGIQDTSQPGGSTKDLSYFQGVVDVWRWLEKRDFDVTPLYFGKFSYLDTDLVLSLNPEYQPLLPSFFVLDRDKYANEMQKIGDWNLFSQKS